MGLSVVSQTLCKIDVLPAFALPMIRTRNRMSGSRRRGCSASIGATEVRVVDRSDPILDDRWFTWRGKEHVLYGVSAHLAHQDLHSGKRRPGRACHRSKQRRGVCSNYSIAYTIQITDKTFRYCFIMVIILETPISFCFSSTIDNGETQEV